MKEMTELERYYNKFNEEKRLNSRHGQVEFAVSMKYIHECIDKYIAKYSDRCPDGKCKILDVGAGTGRYSVALAEEGHDVTAIELVKYNLGILKSKNSSVKAYQGTATKLSRFGDEEFDITLIFGPMYHLFGTDEKMKALNEAKRVTRKGGMILVAYCMNDYAIITYAFKQNNLKKCLEEGKISEDFKCNNSTEDLYDYMTLEDINGLVETSGLQRYKIIAPDGAADYIRPVLNAMDDETFAKFIEYQKTVCERPELLGASSHTLDILINTSDEK